MLNPERVEEQDPFDLVIIGFTNGEGDDALDIILTKRDAIRLGKMLAKIEVK